MSAAYLPQGVALRVELPSSPPAFVSDGTMLLQIFVNLLQNAARFTTEGSVTLTVRELPATSADKSRRDASSSGSGSGSGAVTGGGGGRDERAGYARARSNTSSHLSSQGAAVAPVVTSAAGGEAEVGGDAVLLGFEVSDTGCGMSSEVLATLFDRYTTRGGLGLGLHITKHLVAALGGELRADSPWPRAESEAPQPGGPGAGSHLTSPPCATLAHPQASSPPGPAPAPGACFHFTLRCPRCRKADAAAPAAPYNAPPVLPAAITVLIADDSKLNRRLLRQAPLGPPPPPPMLPCPLLTPSTTNLSGVQGALRGGVAARRGGDGGGGPRPGHRDAF